MKMSMLIKAEEIIVDNTEYNSDEADEMHLALEDSGGENYHQSYQEHQDIMTSPHHDDVNVTSAPNTPSSKNQDPVTKTMMENEKRIRREIANSNERRRMQSINAGFQSLRSLLPRHEGEKLSKAAILQQTAQYILDLEREKTTLLSQNSQLKRQHCQHESTGGNCNGNINQTGVNKITTDTEIVVTTAAGTIAPGQLKKRKLADNIISMQTISDSSDEGLGSMSPEPMTLIATSAIAAGNITSIGIQQQQQQQQQIQTKPATAYISTTAKEVNELRARLENERKRRHLTEERLRQLERQLYQTTPTNNNNNQYIQREVIEHTDNIRDDDITTMIINEQPQQEQHHQQQQQQQIHHLQSQQQQQQIHHHHRQQTQTLKIDPIKLQVVEIDSLPSVGQTQVVVCSSIEEMQDDEADNIINDMNIREEVIMTDENTEIVEVPSRLQPILEAAIKAEPKVEVERINATISKIKGDSTNDDNNDCIGGGGGNSSNNTSGGGGNGNGGSCKRMYLTSTSRQNLETIVEAIRHLEGDHLFGDNIATIEQQQQHKKLQQLPQQQQQLQQDVPLALTTATTTTASSLQTNTPKLQQKSQRNLTKDLSPFLQLKKPTNITIITGKTLNNNSSNNMINNSNLSLSNNNQNINNSNTIITNSTIVVSSNNIINASIKKSENITTSAAPPPVPTSLITATQLKQCRPGVIVAKQTS